MTNNQEDALRLLVEALKPNKIGDSPISWDHHKLCEARDLAIKTLAQPEQAPAATGKDCLQVQAPAAAPASQLVPVEPTDAMKMAGAETIRNRTTILNQMFLAKLIYMEMLKVAPTPPTAEKA